LRAGACPEPPYPVVNHAASTLADSFEDRAFEMNRYAVALALVILGTNVSRAQEQTFEIGETVRISGGLGYSFINSDEIVYDGAGNRISHLFWETQAPTLSAALQADFANNWSLRVAGRVAVSGSSHMEDYDWIGPFFRSYDFSDWTHRSIHTDTRLHHYFSGDVALGRDIALGGAVLNLNGGLKYTSVHWTAYGGTFVYSDTGFRADTATFPAGGRVISFLQRYPALFVGADLSASAGRFTFAGQVRGGVAIGATDTDYHWLRDLRFEERYGAIPFASVTARVEYAFNPGSSLFLSGSLDQYFHALGDSTTYAISTGAPGSTSPNAAGMTLRAITVTAGLKARF